MLTFLNQTGGSSATGRPAIALWPARIGASLGSLHSIRVRFVAFIAAAMTLVYGAVAYNQIQETSSRLNDELNQQNVLLASVYAEALAADVWNLNRTAMTRQLNLLVTHQDIVSAEIQESNDLFTMASSNGRVVTYPGDATDEHLTITRPIRYQNGDVVGQLTISVSRDRIEAERSFLFHDQVQRFLIIAMVVILVVVVTVSNLIGPIIMITQTMTKVADGDLRIPIPGVTRRDELGDMARALAVFKDNAEQLQGALDRERELNGLQRQFVSMVSHEFRTPLAIVDGNAQRLQRRLPSMPPERVAKTLKTIRQSVSRLTELMESVLDAAHLEEGRIKFEPNDVALGTMLQDMVESHRGLYPDRSFDIHLNGVPSTMLLDERLMRQVFSNLMSNAVKYSGDGSPVRLSAWRDGNETVCITVSDEGVGIPKDELDQLFERFFRASTSTGIAGSGIGLHLVNHFVDLHGGYVDVESEEGVGTTFTVRLPYSTTGAKE